MIISANIPPPSSPAVDKDGYMTQDWWRFLLSLLNRTGGAGVHYTTADTAEQAAVSAVENMSPEPTAVQSALRLIADLEMPDRAWTSPNLERRVAALEDAGSMAPINALTIQKLSDLEGLALDARPPVPSPQFVLPTPEGWSAPTLTNSWANFGNGYNPAGYFIDPWGIVHLRGRISTGAIGVAAFNLPAGYRPAFTEQQSTDSTAAFGVVEIFPASDVVPTIGLTASFSLDGITFRAA